ncbi:TIGR02530 family flagellar biosynthesis protein [Clostridium septicum]|uniref:Flagellar biosynthesis protein n=1 Tax=Clostridium septicum TaxID=1504 RepID=A0A9N7JJV3_CLOSE|nr:TIGR02530 family flagellar biosynthesis protein [Clostridium septicum]AYE33425.1 flagellar biosynthesis protein [Clostridium septicum]QAS61599.1 flagellar biosynthesis protein [Clostridium septicum]UEC21965.1 flagellar biosynthesis protein [Clostridium septicum]USS00004.1 flagellar biosynthesis protein [Clostridium septicum]
MGFRIVNGSLYPVDNLQAPIQNDKNRELNSKNSTFKNILDKTIGNSFTYTLSKHAVERLKYIDFSNKDMKAIEKGFQMAEKKGAKNCVMIYKDTALIASVQNKTVITAVEKERAKENVFTNIDSVVIL